MLPHSTTVRTAPRSRALRLPGCAVAALCSIGVAGAGAPHGREPVLDVSLRLETAAAVRRAGLALGRMQSKSGGWSDSISETALAALALACTPRPVRSECLPPEAAGRALAWLEKAACKKQDGAWTVCETWRLLALKTLGAPERMLRPAQDRLLSRLERAAHESPPPAPAAAVWALAACQPVQRDARRRIDALAAACLRTAQRRNSLSPLRADDAGGGVLLAHHLGRKREIRQWRRIFLSACAKTAAAPEDANEIEPGAIALRVGALLEIAEEPRAETSIRRRAANEVRRIVRGILAAQRGDGLWDGPPDRRVRTAADALLALDVALAASDSRIGPFF